MATQATNPNDSTKQPFPFMKLPAELRLIIYELALDDVIPTLTSVMMNITYCGASCAVDALALLLTSKEVRVESSKAMMPSMLGHLESYKMRVDCVERECDELQRKRFDDDYEDDKVFPIEQQSSGLEDTMCDAHFFMDSVSSVHLAVSRAAKDHLT